MTELVRCENVHKSYRMGSSTVHVLKGLDLSISEGSIVAISGASGIGKSTLLHIMGTLDRPTDGRIVINNTDVTSLDRRRLNRIRNEKIGFVFQFYHLINEFTAVENVMLPALVQGRSKSELTKKSIELLESVGLAERLDHRPNELSGGEQQRVAIARALFNEPSIILADEPTGNLDEKTSDEIVSLLWNIHRERATTMVIVTHEPDIASRADQWVKIEDGQAVPVEN
jgi:ABC-type lipoprotein export system ATPase subunit